MKMANSTEEADAQHERQDVPPAPEKAHCPTCNRPQNCDVHGRTCLVIDDLIDTAGTLVKTARALLENGATQVYACASHAVLSGPAIENISKSDITEVVVTNTIPLSDSAHREPKIKVLSIAGLIGRAIQSIHEETSVSKLFM